MKNNTFKRSIALFLVLVCILGILPVSAFAAEVTPPASITQISSSYVTINGHYARYRAGSDAINNVGYPYIFNEQVNIPGYGPGRALCAYQLGTLGTGADGQKWNFESEATHPSLVAILSYVYSFTNGTFTDAGKAAGLGAWNEPWANLWFMVAQAMSWLHEHGVLIDYNVDKAGFMNQLAGEFLAAYKMYHDVYGWSGWIANWDALTINSIIDSADGGATGKTALDIANESMHVILDYPQYFMKYRLWIYDWDDSQPWLIYGQEGTPMQKLLIAVPVKEPTIPEHHTVRMTIKKLEAGTNKPLAGATFKVESADGSGSFSVTRTTGADGTITLTDEVDNLTAGQYRITEVAAPAGYTIQNASQVVTVMPDDSASCVFSFYNKPDGDEKKDGDGSIRKVDADNPAVGLAGAVIKLTSVKLDDGGSFTSTYTTGDGGYISKEDLDFSKLPTGSYTAEEITPPQGYILSSDTAKVKQAFTWDGEHDVSLVFENSSKVKVQLKKTDVSGNPLPGAVFVVLRDGQIISTEETQGDGTITVSNVTEGYYEFREVSAPAGYDCDHTPVGVHVEAKDLQGEQTITVTKVNHRKRTLTITKRDAETGKPIAQTAFHVHGVNLGYENDVVTGADGKVSLPEMASGCYEITETSVPAPYILDVNNRQTVWIDAEKDQDVTVDFVNSTKPGLRLVKTDYETGKPLAGVTFKVEQVDGGYSDQHITDSDGLIVLDNLTPGAYVVTEVKPAPGYVADTMPRTVLLEANKTTTIEIANIKLSTFRLIKTSSDGSNLAGVHFRIARIEDGTHYLDRITDVNGEINIDGLEPGVYSVKETATTEDHILDVKEYHVELFPGKTSTITIENQKRPSLIISKTDKDTGAPVPGVTFTLRGADGPTITTKPTDANGKIEIKNLLPGVYTITEQSVPEGYILDSTPQTVTLFPNKEAQVEFQNYQRPTLKIVKVDVAGKHLTGAIFEVKTKAGVKIGDFPVDANGEITVPQKHLTEGYYIITEIQAPVGYILDKTPHEVYLRPGKTTEVSIENEKKPGLTIYKVDSVVGDGVKGAKFEIWVSKDKNQNGTYQQLTNSYYFTDENGIIHLESLDTGWYKIVEVEPPAGYMLKEPSEQVVYVEHDTAFEVTFENIPKSALVIRKIDAATGAPLANAWFRVRYLGGTSGSGGTIIGEYQTSSNGNIIITGLDAGTYVCEEISAPHGYVMDTAPQTAYISGKEQDCITLTFTNSKYGSLLIKKIDSVTKQPMSDVQFYITNSDGGLIGNANGYFTTDSAGTILVSDIMPGTTLVVKETRTLPGYVLDDVPQTVKIKSNETVTLEFRNQPSGSILIRKVCSVNPSVTLQNAEFKIAYSDGTLVGDNNGVFRTDEAGEIRVDGLIPGKSVVVTETRAPAGFMLDTQSQTVEIKAGKTVSLTFKNQPKGAIIIQKRDSQTGEVLSGAEFRVTTAAGCEVGLDGVIGNTTLTQNGIFVTDSQGEIKITNLAPGAYIISEIKAPDGYVIDTPSTNVVIGQGGDTQTVIVKNTKKGNLIVEKYDSVTKQPISGAQFKITTASGELVASNEGMTSSNGLYTTNAEGQIVLSKLLPDTYVVTETKAPDGYQLDPNPQTVVVKAGDTQSLRFYDDPLCNLTIAKLDSVTGKPIPNTVFEVKDGNGNLFGRYTTGKDGTVIVTGLAPGSTVVVTEVKVPDGYVLNSKPQTITLKKGSGNTVTSSGTGSSPSGSGSGGDLVFENDPKTKLIIEKYISGTTTPLKGVTFLVTDSSGELLGNENGEFVTDENGRIVIEGLEPGTTVVAKEIRTLEGYILDTTPKSIKIKVGAAQTLKFYNQPKGCIVIRKLDSVTKKPLAGVEFQLTYADGSYVDADNGHLSSKGLYTTNKNGEIRISGVVGTIIVTETKTIDGYTIDEASRTQTVKVNAQDTQTLTFYNAPVGGLELIKVSEADKTQRIPDTTFEIRRASDGGLVKTVTTGKNGRVYVDLDAGSYYAVEIEAAKGFKLDSTPNYFTVKSGETCTLTVKNAPLSGILIHKTDSVTGKALQGVTFLLYDSKNTPIGQATTDNEGYAYFENLSESGRHYLKEMDNPGYVPDTQLKTVYVKAGETTLVEWKNIPMTVQNQITKKSADYNSTNGLPAGSLLEGAAFEIRDKAGNLVDTIKSDKNGVAASKPLPLGRYTIRETVAPANYVASDKELTAYLEHAGQIVRFEVTNKSVTLGVSIKKTGYAEVMPGQNIRYTFSDIANTSSVPLQSFYWRDTLPVNAVRLAKITTGTYSAPGSYKISYMTNLSDGKYRTMYDNLSTSKNYTLDASPIGLGLASNEYVTQFLFEFGVVPAGFHQVEAPKVDCTVVSWIQGGSQFVNNADVGGAFNGRWLRAVTRWVTKVYGKPTIPNLPKTGY